MTSKEKQTNMSSEARIDVHDMFERIVPTYDFLNHFFSLNIDKRWRKKLVKTAAVPSGGTVLDICTGTADVAVAFARSDESISVLGVDFSEKMLERGREKVKASGHADRIELKQGDAAALEAPDASYDAVTVAFGLRNVYDREKGIFEMARTAKKEGRVLILEFVPPSESLFGRIYGWYLRNVMPAIGGLISGFRPSYTYLYASISEFMQPHEILEVMERAGLSDCRAEKLTGGIAYLFHGLKQ